MSVENRAAIQALRRRSATSIVLASGVALTAMLMSACGGGGAAAGTESAAIAQFSDMVNVVAVPTFDIAPVALTLPDANDDAATIHTDVVLPGMDTLSTTRLLPATIESQTNELLSARSQMGLAMAATPVKKVTVYTPAQIRRAYQLAAVTGSAVPARAVDRQALGAGQTIYLIDANDHPNAFLDLSAFSQQFGLPGCTNIAITAATSLPLAPASTSAGCTFSKVFADANGHITSVAPAYDASWAMEIAMDVQEAHAMAPLARIVLIEASAATLQSLYSAVALANTLGNGMVSMSFGAPEGNWTAAVDSVFQTSNMQYFASTGDSGVGVSWPSVSSHVVAVGGTTLSFNGVMARSEVVWSGTGGGNSAYVATPSYQAALSPALASRRVADVAFDADPYSGQFVAFTAKNGTRTWFSGGGTSIAAPAWAAMAAVINAQRAAGGLAMLASFQNGLYFGVLPNAGNYSSAFLDIAHGSDGSCATCSAGTGYDAPTGLGTPNLTALMGILGAYTTTP